jgi:hypothetical protein
MDEAEKLRIDIARYRRTLRIVFDPEAVRRVTEMIKVAEERLSELERTH